MKKILLGLGALAVVLVALPLFSAFEAHVINVVAQIENALAVNTEPITFGTVFPQEHLERPLSIALSSSFLTEDRVDDVAYIIRQKPKCGGTTDGGTVLVGPTATGHVIPTTTAPEGYVIDCGPEPEDLPEGADWGVLPSLCEYISKEPDNLPENDGIMPSFHQPFTVTTSTVNWNDTVGRLAKSEQDQEDNWIIDLAVPCFGGFCAQDWADFVANINPDVVDADEYTQPIENEHKVFGCDLWVEVTDVSETPTNGNGEETPNG